MIRKQLALGRRRRHTLLLAVTAVVLAGCAREEGPEASSLVRVDLADLDFVGAAPDSALGVVASDPFARAWFAHGWDRPDAEGIWTDGDSASVVVDVHGREPWIELVFSTHPDLAEDEQTVGLALNGRDLGAELGLRRGWAPVRWRVPLPGELVHEGPDTLTLTIEGTRERRHSERKISEIGVFLRRLRVSALLDSAAAERHRLDPALELPPPPPLVTLPEGPPAPAVAPSDAADVLVVVFDAARPDHFGCYGYGRATSATVDSLAAVGVRMNNVTSVAPYTAIAVPSLMSGFGWERHGVLTGESALAEDFVTMAEVFRENGFHTMAWTENPYASAATGIDQGFNEFEAVWEVPGHPGINVDPDWTGSRVAARLAEGTGRMPIFAYVHFMPPHDPYRVEETDHVFGDPAYEGSIDGSTDQLQAIIEERRPWTEADRRELVALYDGSMRRIDRSFASLLRQWKRARRDRPLTVVFLSDHGEAFAEHGEFGHLTTVYPEMTDIPLVIAGAGADAWRGHEETFLAIHDIAPLLLRGAGASLPPGTTWSSRFLRLHAQGIHPREFALLRTTPSARTWGVRTADALAVFDGRVQQEFYDLRSDPRARVDLRGRESERFRGWILRLRSVLLRGRGAVGPPAAQHSPESLRLLESLGYTG